MEVSVCSRNKYEYKPKLGAIMLGWALSDNIRYPGGYGFVPSTVRTNDKPLDVTNGFLRPSFLDYMIRARLRPWS